MRAGVLIALAFAPTQAVAAPQQATATARAVVLQPLTLVKTQDLDFGRIIPATTGGTVTVDENTGQCSYTGAIKAIGPCAYASFAGKAGSNGKARISLTQIVNLTGPGTTMVLSNVKLGVNPTINFAGNTNANGNGVGLTQGNGNQRYNINSATGVFTLNIGGTLTVNANQAPGVYTGSITVDVQYN